MEPVQYAVVAYLRDPVGQFVEALRGEVHPKHAHLPSHISILPPRPLHGTEKEAVERMDQVCAAVAPFEITMGEIATFAPTTPTVFIRLARAAYRLRELHDRLNSGPLRAEEPWPYMPHLTIAKMDTLEQSEHVLAEASQRWEHYASTRTVLIDELTFVRQAGPDRWIDIAPVPLGRGLANAQ